MYVDDPSGYIDGSTEIEKEMRSVWQENEQVFMAWQQQADIDTRFVYGDQSYYTRYFPNILNPQEFQMSFNELLKCRNSILGYQIKTRKSPQAIPQENSDSKTASQFSGLLQWNFKKNGFYNLVTEAFDQAIITGFGAIELWLDKSEDPISPEIKGILRGYSNTIFDPYCKDKGFKDAQYIWTRSYLSRSEAMKMLPGRDKDISSVVSYPIRDKDMKFQFMLENWNFTPRDFVAVDVYHHRTTRKAKIMIDVVTGDYFELPKEIDKDRIQMILEQGQGRIEYIKKDIPTVMTAIALNNRVMYHGRLFDIDEYPIIPCFGYWNPLSPQFSIKCQGIIRAARDLQFLYSRRKKIELSILESRGTSTLAIMEGTLVDDRQAFQTGEGRALFVKRDAPMGMAGIQPLPPPTVGADMLQISASLRQEIPETIGLTPEVMGQGQGEAGIVEMLRQSAGLTTLGPLLDNCDFFMCELAKRQMSMMQSNWTPSKVRRILNEDPSPQFYNKAFERYDVIATEGFFSDTQRQMEFAQKLELRQLGVPISAKSLLESCTIQNKDKLMEEINQQEQAQQQAAQQQQQLELQQIEANNELVRARAIADSGLGAERYSRIQENKQLAKERQSQARKDDTDALLNFIKALQELDGIQLQNIEKAMKLKELISPTNTQEPIIPQLNQMPLMMEQQEPPLTNQNPQVIL